MEGWRAVFRSIDTGTLRLPYIILIRSRANVLVDVDDRPCIMGVDMCYFCLGASLAVRTVNEGCFFPEMVESSDHHHGLRWRGLGLIAYGFVPSRDS